jgi:hypothetical protein
VVVVCVRQKDAKNTTARDQAGAIESEGRGMTKRITVDELHKKWLKERPGYTKAYADLEEEFQLASQMIEARGRAV